MKFSFAVKLGLLLVTVITTLTGAILFNSYSYSRNVTYDDFKASISAVTNTGAFVFNEEARDVIESLKQRLNQSLAEESNIELNDWVKTLKPHDVKPALSAATSNQLQDSLEFQTLVQLLRRVKAGGGKVVAPLRLLDQSDSGRQCSAGHDNPKASVGSGFVARRVYLSVPISDVDPSEAVMLLANSNYESEMGGDAKYPIGDTYRPKAKFSSAFRNGELSISNWYVDEFDPCIKIMTAAIPIKNEAGKVIAVLGADYPILEFEQRVNELEADSWNLFGIAAAIAFIFTLVVGYWVVVPLTRLREGAVQLLRHNFSHRVNVTSTDEFGVLATTINKVSETLGDFTLNLERIVEERTVKLSAANEEVVQLNELLQRENAHLGAEVDSLIRLREKQLEHVEGKIDRGKYAINFRYLPTRSVGGDFWHVGQNHDDLIELSYGQVSGYGLETATTVLQLQALFKSLAGEPVSSQLKNANDYLYSQQKVLTNPLFAKVLYITLSEDRMSISGYGEPPIAFNNHQVEELASGFMSTPLGLDSKIEIGTEKRPFGNMSYLLFSAGFRQAVLKLHNVQDLNLTPQRFLELTGLREAGVDDLSARLRAEDWFENFEDDVSFILIERRVNL